MVSFLGIAAWRSTRLEKDYCISHNKQMTNGRVGLCECEYVLVSLAPLQMSSAPQKNKTDMYVRSFQ